MSGRHRAPRTPLAERVQAALPAGLPVLGGVAAGALGAVGGVLVPGVASAAGQPATPHRDTALVQVPAGARFAPPTADELARLRGCESTGQYGIDTGNGFYGAYQFDLGTWRGLGLDGYPSQAGPDTQDAAASALEQSRGWEPWPSCSAQLGLVSRRAHDPLPAVEVLGRVSSESATVAATARPASGVRPTVVAATGRHRRPLGAGPTLVQRQQTPAYTAAAPAFGGHVLSTADAATYRSDVRLWQERMAQRGWALAADGYFGPRSQAVARAFAAEKDLVEGLPGEVGPRVWAAAWVLPV